MPTGFGTHNGFPFRFGGGRSLVEDEFDAMLDMLAPGYDIDDPALRNEVRAHARAVATIWVANKRAQNQSLPLRMLENLTTWEEATGLRPGLNDLDTERRKRLAAKLRGLAGNTLADISDTCSAIFGDNFETVVTVDPAKAIVYWPGGAAIPNGMSAPGPPGREWSSNRAHIAIRLSHAGLSDELFAARRSALHQALNAMMPAWMTFTIGVGSSGFICGQGICGQTLL